MNGNVSDFLPTLQERAAALYEVMIPIAAVLLVGAVIVSVSRAGTDPAAYLRTILGVGVITLAIAFMPDWANQAQLIAHGITNTLGASPANVHERFARLVAGVSADSEAEVGLFDVVFAKNGGLGHAVLYGFVLLLAKMASAIMWLFFVLQQTLIQFQIGFSPVFLAMFMIEPLRNVAVQFQMGLIAVYCWPIGWSISALMTDTLLKLAATNKIYQIADDFYVGGPQTMFLIIVLTIWILLSTIGAPLLIRKLLTSGANVGAALLANVGAAMSQGAIYGASAGATVGLAGGSNAMASGAAAIGGVGGAASGALGSAGNLIPASIGIGAALAVSNSAQGGGADYNTQAANYAKKARS